MSVGKDSFIKRYGVNFTEQEYVVNPAIGREKELRELSTPNKEGNIRNIPILILYKNLCIVSNIFIRYKIRYDMFILNAIFL